jgi:PST family polysaccharide transporter
VGSLGRLGAEWACLAVVCAFTLNLFMHALVIRWQDGVPVSQVLGGAVGPLLACVPMAAAVVGIRVLAVAHGIDRGPLLLAGEIVAGGLVYVGAAFVFAGDTARDLLSILSRMRGKK